MENFLNQSVVSGAHAQTHALRIHNNSEEIEQGFSTAARRCILCGARTLFCNTV